MANYFAKIFDNYEFTIGLKCFVGTIIKKPTQKFEWENCYEKEKVYLPKKAHANVHN